MRSAASVARTARSSSRPGAGAMTSVQMPSVCTVSTTGHAAACPDRAAGDQHRELADELHPLLGQQAAGEQALPGRRVAGDGRQPVGGLVGGRDDAHALAVVAAAGGLEHHRPADLVPEGLQRRRRSPTCAHRGHGTPMSVSRRRIASLSWAKTRAAGLGCSDDAVGLQRGEDVGRDVLVVERHDVAGAGEGAHRLEVGVAPDRRGRDDEGGRGIRRLGQHGEGDRQADGGWLAHPRQLATADDADDGKSSGGALRRRHGTRAIGRAGTTLTAAGPTLSQWLLHTPPCCDRARGAMDVLVREMLKFGVVGAVAFVVDIGVFNLLRFGFADGTLPGSRCGPRSSRCRWRR